MDFKPYKMGKYLLLERLAAGGMAEVYRAKATGAGGFEKWLAIKKILPNHMEDETFERMFQSEARMGSSLQHANIVPTLDFVQFGETYLLVMEFVNGKNLRQVVNKLKKLQFTLPLECCLYIINETCKGLDYAHSKRDDITGQPQNIIHRDMSPQNIMISYEGAVKIVDFGIAKGIGKLEQTKSGVIKGKFGYMSPEQAVGQDVTSATDIFSTGIILWELVTGKRLFTAESDFATLKLIQDCVIPKPSTVNPKVSPELEKIILKTLSKQISHRYQSAGALQKQLQEFLNKQYPSFGSKDVSTMMQRLFSEEIENDKKRFEQLSKQSVLFSQGNTNQNPEPYSVEESEEPLEGTMTNSEQDMVSHVTFIDDENSSDESLDSESDAALSESKTKGSRSLKTDKSETEPATVAKTQHRLSSLGEKHKPSEPKTTLKPNDNELAQAPTQEKTKVVEQLDPADVVKNELSSPKFRLQEITKTPARVLKPDQSGTFRKTLGGSQEKTDGSSVHLELDPTSSRSQSQRAPWDFTTDNQTPASETEDNQNIVSSKEDSFFPGARIVAGLALFALTTYFYIVLFSGEGVIPTKVSVEDPRTVGYCNPKINKKCNTQEKSKKQSTGTEVGLVPTNCELRFETDPPGAKVLIDGAEKITTPGTTLVPCDSSLNYSLQSEEFETVAENIFVTAKTKMVFKNLRKIEKGNLVITVDRRVKVYSETDLLGEAEPGKPFEIEKIRANKNHRIRFLNEVFGVDQTRTFLVKPGVNNPYDVRLDETSP